MPVIDMAICEPVAFWVIETVAERGPTALGVNARVSLQDEPGATVAPQVVVTEKSLFMPVSEILATESADPPGLLSVTKRTVLLTPTVCEPNAVLVALRTACGGRD